MSWSGVADYSLSNTVDTLAVPVADDDSPLSGGSEKQLGALPPPGWPNMQQGSTTPFSAMDTLFDVPASQGLPERLRVLAKQADTTVLEVLRRLSEAERKSAHLKEPASKSELAEYFKTFMECTAVDIEACFRLQLPLGTWEHVSRQIATDWKGPRTTMATALYWRAKHRKERLAEAKR